MSISNKNIAKILDSLRSAYPDAGCELSHDNVYELLVKVTLSAQTTDVSVNKVSPQLFAAYPVPAAMADADISKLEEILRSIGMYKIKSRNIINQAKIIMANFEGKVPESDEALKTLPGVGRKTANVVMSIGFGHQRIAVDTHVYRISHRLGFSKDKDVLKTELTLMKLLPEDRWTEAHHSFIFHGRRCCTARNPKCSRCAVEELCPKVGLVDAGKASN